MMLGNSLFMRSPAKDPVKIIGIDPKASLYWIKGFPLYALRNRLKVLPAEVPTTHEYTTKLASLGRYEKNAIKITIDMEPPPIPANVARLLENPSKIVPKIIENVGGQFE